MTDFYNMLISSGCIPDHASAATAFLAVLLVYGFLQIVKTAAKRF